MLQTRDGFRFSAETLHHAGCGRLFRQDHFEGHLALRPMLNRAIDDAHAAARDLFNQIVMKRVAFFGFVKQRCVQQADRT